MPKHSVLGYQIKSHGGPEVLQLGSLELPELGPTDVLVRHGAVGVNFIDIYFREGLYPMDLPGALGLEAAGVVEAVGSEVTHVKVGERVAYCMSPMGAYAEAHVVPQHLLIPVPSYIDDITAAAITLKGLTAAFLLTSLRPLNKGDSIVVHAAAGGVGQLLCQWARDMGLRVIGAVGSEGKVATAKTAGCDHVVVTQNNDWASQVRGYCSDGVQVVYDSVGADTCEASLNCLARRGWFVSYGNSSGPAPAVLPLTLMQKGSLVMTRPSLADFISDRDELLALAGELFDKVKSGSLQVKVGLTVPLSEAAKAHQMLKDRKTTGSTVLTVE